VLEICDQACSGLSPHVTFTYDAEGHRIQIDESEGGSGSTTNFRYAGGAITAEYVDGALTREYLIGEAGGVAKMVIPASQPNPGTYVVNWNGHGDALGLWRIKADGSLELANSFAYGTWGEPQVVDAVNSATGQPYGDLHFRFLYAGQYGVQYDDFGTGLNLYYMFARHYSPEMGRFLQPDPSRIEENLYSYADNRPLSRVDPTGEFPCAVPVLGWIACATAVVVVVGGVVLYFYYANQYQRWYNFYWASRPQYPPYARPHVYKAENWLLTKNKQLRTRKAGLQRQIDKHERKIRENPNDPSVEHWEHEVRNWKRQISDIDRRLNHFARLYRMLK
jgi:RHS repeat-associated protein